MEDLNQKSSRRSQKYSLHVKMALVACLMCAPVSAMEIDGIIFSGFELADGTVVDTLGDGALGGIEVLPGTVAQHSKKFEFSADPSYYYPEDEVVAATSEVLAPHSQRTRNSRNKTGSNTDNGQTFASAIGGANGGGGGATLFKPFTPNAPVMKASIFQSLSQMGPMELKNDHTRAWIMPFYSFGGVKGSNGTRETSEGATVGFEKHLGNKGAPIVLGVFGGGVFDDVKQKVSKDGRIKTKGLIFGAYGDIDFAQNARFSLILDNFLDRSDAERTINGSLARSSYNTRVYSINPELMYKFNLDKENRWALRPTVGMIALESNRHAYNEYVGSTAVQKHVQKTVHSRPVYAGLALRYQHSEDNDYQYRGKVFVEQLAETASIDTKSNITGASGQSATVNSPAGARHTTVVGVTGLILKKSNHLRFAPVYSCTMNKDRIDHTFMIKFEKRF